MFAEFFIRRPVFASVCAILIVLGGAASIPSLPIAQYPELAAPQVQVQSNYVGASAQVVESAVTTPLEQQINGAEGMRYMSSTSGSDGTSLITVTFDVGRNKDLAAVDVQNRVNAALPRLPAEVKNTGVIIAKTTPAIVVAAGFTSEDPGLSNLFISNYIDLYVRDELKRIPGVADVRVFGERKYAMRLWLDPVRLAARELSATDVVAALREQNAIIAAGQVGQPPAPAGQTFQISVRAAGRLTEPREFEDLVLKRGDDGTLVTLRDVGRAELGAEDYSLNLRFDGKDAVGIGVFQQADANALALEAAVREELARLAPSFPPGMKYKIAFDPTIAVRESIREVLKTLVEAIALVILVIFLFLQSGRATVIPAITIPVSLVGTFIFVNAFGFSINTLTLFGIVLATGLVVDDAIVVVENISRNLAEEGHHDPHAAASRAMGEVAGRRRRDVARAHRRVRARRRSSRGRRAASTVSSRSRSPSRSRSRPSTRSPSRPRCRRCSCARGAVTRTPRAASSWSSAGSTVASRPCAVATVARSAGRSGTCAGRAWRSSWASRPRSWCSATSRAASSPTRIRTTSSSR